MPSRKPDRLPNGHIIGGNFVESVTSVAMFVILAVQSVFFGLGGIRDNFAPGLVVMPDEEYLQSWFHDTRLGLGWANRKPTVREWA